MRWICFIAAAGILPLLTRLYLFLIPVPLNVDEAQFTVTARSSLNDPILWRAIDMQTSGPLNALVVAWPLLFHAMPSILSSRLTGFVIESVAILGMASLVRPGRIWSLGMAAALTTVLWMGLRQEADYTHYSSELLSLALICAFCVVFCRLPIDRSAGFGLAACGLLASCLPFAKMQSSLFFALFHVFCIARIVVDARAGRLRYRDVLFYLFLSALPALVLVIPLFFVGEQNAFLLGYLKLTSSYGGQKIVSVFRRPLPIITVSFLFMAATLYAGTRFCNKTHARVDLLLLASAMWPVTLLTMWLPGRYYFHYQLYAIFCLPLSVIVAQYALADVPSVAVSRKWKVVVAALIVLAITPFSTEWLHTLRIAGEDAAYDLPAHPAERRAFLDWARPASNDTVFQWGWEPGLTAYSGMRSADRASIAEYLIRPNTVRDYLRSRLLRDFHRNSPTIVMDTVREGYFFANLGPDVKYSLDSHLPDADPKRMNLRTFPELYTFVTKNYREIAGDDNRCAGLYVRGDMAGKIQSAEIPLQSSTPALTSSWGTERCQDWWEPSRNDALAQIQVTPAQPVGELWILTSRGGPAEDRGTTRVRITYFAVSGQNKEQIVGLYDYPDWTVVNPPVAEPLSKISIQSVSFVGDGPALAAVKAFKAGWARQLNRDQ